jgi:hypothetical protein
MVEFMSHVKSEDHSFIFNDNKFDSLSGSLVDIICGLGCEYLNMRGFLKAEKIAKV